MPGWRSALRKAQAAAAKENIHATQGANAPAAKPPSSPRPSTTRPAARTGRFAAVVAAAVETDAASKSATAPLTADAVEFASKPCGAIYRYCASCASAAVELAAERAKAESALEAALKRLAGLEGEHAATEAYLRSLKEEAARREALRKAAEKAIDTAVDARLEALVTAKAAAATLAGLQAAADNAMRLAMLSKEALERRKDAEEKRLRDKDAKAAEHVEAMRNAQAEIEKDLASRVAKVWLHEHELPDE